MLKVQSPRFVLPIKQKTRTISFLQAISCRTVNLKSIRKDSLLASLACYSQKCRGRRACAHAVMTRAAAWTLGAVLTAKSDTSTIAFLAALEARWTAGHAAG